MSKPSKAEQIRQAYHQLDRFIQAAEGEQYPDSITADKKSFAKLLALEASWERAMSVYLKGLAERVPTFINWAEYRRRTIQADELVVTATAVVMEEENKILLNVLFDFVAEGESIGAEAGTRFYNVPINQLDLQAAIQREARKHAASLAKGLNKTTLKAVRSSIEASIELGEDIETATKRVQKLVNDPQRANMIARTEAVNSYGQGIDTFGHQTGAKAHWLDVVFDDRTSPICTELSNKYGNPNKAIPLSKAFKWQAQGGGSKKAPGFHVHCRTGKYLVY